MNIPYLSRNEEKTVVIIMHNMTRAEDANRLESDRAVAASRMGGNARSVFVGTQVGGIVGVGGTPRVLTEDVVEGIDGV